MKSQKESSSAMVSVISIWNSSALPRLKTGVFGFFSSSGVKVRFLSVAIVSCDEKQGWEEEVSEGPLPLYLCYASFFYYVLVVDIVEVVIAVVVIIIVVGVVVVVVFVVVVVVIAIVAVIVFVVVFVIVIVAVIVFVVVVVVVVVIVVVVVVVVVVVFVVMI